MAERDVIDSIQRYIQRLEAAGIPVSFVVLYGSQAHGNVHEWSDIDLLVVSPRYDEPLQCADMELLAYLAALVDSRIEPIPCGERQWADDDSSALIEIARREGQKIRAA